MIPSPARRLVLAFASTLLAGTAPAPGASGASGPAGGSTWRIEGGEPGALLGSSLATADVNGDGFGDLVVGAPGFDDLYPGEGRVSVYLGSPGGLALVPDWTRYGRQRGARFGAQVANAGDVNGDGFEDLLVAAPAFDRLGSADRHVHLEGSGGHQRYATDEGRVQLFLGSAAGLASLPQRTLTGIELGERFGSAIAGVGDVNGDGRDDVLIGATGKARGLGGLLLFAGTAGGLAALPSWIGLGSELDAGWGSLAGAAGDVNQDGYADFLGARPHSGSCSQLVLFHGSPAGPGTGQTIAEGVLSLGPWGDFDQDGLVEQLLVSDCPVPALRWRNLGGPAAGGLQAQGTPAVVLAADLNGDGREDLIASAPDFESGPFHGRVRAYMNRPGQTFSPTSSFPVYDGTQPDALWGAALAAIDVDGDGAEELFIAAPLHDAGEEDVGLVELVPGWPEGLSLALTSYSPLLADHFVPFISTGDFDADGFDDLVTQLGYAGELGQLEVHHGSPAGPGELADATLQPPPLAGHNQLFVGTSTGDVNGDGFDDLQVTFNAHTYWGHGAYLVDVFQHALYTGSSGGLSTSPVWTLPGGSASEAEIVGDVNGDGFDDVYVVLVGGDQLFLGSSAGLSTLAAQTFPPAQTLYSTDAFGSFGFGERHRAVLAGDLDGDAYGDVLVARYTYPGYDFYLDLYRGSSTGLVLQGGGDVGAELGDPAYYFVSLLAWEDFDGDGYDDLLTELVQESALLAGSADGFTRAPQWWEPLEPGSGSWTFFDARILAVFDADLDGRQDLLLEGMRLHCGSPSGIQRTPDWFGTLDYPLQILCPAADFDGDGRTDLTAASYTWPDYGMRVYEVDGN
jgi:hypothetical protein